MSSFSLSAAKTLSAELADLILRHIREEKLAPGSHLGTELQLAKKYGISRTVVREAIGALRGLGVVATRQGTGVFVAQPDMRPILSKIFSHSAAADKGWRELASFRVVIELGALPLAVEHATDEQIARLAQLVEEMRMLVENAEGEPFALRHAFVEKDLAFHELLFEAADSALATQFHQVLMDYFHQGEESFAMPDRRVVDEHNTIVQAITARDAGAAIRVMSAHLYPILAVARADQVEHAEIEAALC